MKISNIRSIVHGAHLASLHAKVVSKFTGTSGPVGPLDSTSTTKLVLVIQDSGHQNKKLKMYVFLYDIWATKCEFIKVSDEFVISGGKDIVFPYTYEEHFINKCLCIGADNNSATYIGAVAEGVRNNKVKSIFTLWLFRCSYY